MAALCAQAEWVYVGQWGREGSGYGEFAYPHGIAVAPNGNVYVADVWNCRIQYFTPAGSFLGYWDTLFWHPKGVAVSPDGKRVYVADTGNSRIRYFTSQGSLLGEWGRLGFHLGDFDWPDDVAVAPNGTVFVSDTGNRRVQYFTPDGSFLGAWRPGRPGSPRGIFAVSRYTVYLADGDLHCVYRFNYEGGSWREYYWGSFGAGNGQFNIPTDVAYDPSLRRVFVADVRNHRIQYFTRNGSFLGQWGSRGRGPGEFDYPVGVAFAPNGCLYVTEEDNYRVQYFRWSDPAVSPASLGRVKALFR
jgi:DNA-binding beta-propeller fold protein YncE